MFLHFDNSCVNDRLAMSVQTIDFCVRFRLKHLINHFTSKTLVVIISSIIWRVKI